MISVPIWKPVANYLVKAALTSRFRDSLDEVAQNRKGKTSLVFTLVILYPDRNNAVDPNAILVTTQQDPPKLLGYLPREQAGIYRKRMVEAGYGHMISACEAVLSSGLVTSDKVYDYILELDLDMSSDPSPEHLVIHPELVRLPSDPNFKKDVRGDYRFKCWLPHDAIGNLHPKRLAMGWTTDSWGTVNYYLSNAKNIGLGFKVLSVPKDKHAGVFGEKPVNVIVEEIQRRWVTLRLEK